MRRFLLLISAGSCLLVLTACGSGSGTQQLGSDGQPSPATGQPSPVTKSPPPESPNLKVTLSPTSASVGSTVQISATGCIDPNSKNHSVSFNREGHSPGAANNPNTVVAIPSTLSGDQLTAQYTVTQMDRAKGGGTVFVQCGATLQQVFLTVA